MVVVVPKIVLRWLMGPHICLIIQTICILFRFLSSCNAKYTFSHGWILSRSQTFLTIPNKKLSRVGTVVKSCGGTGTASASRSFWVPLRAEVKSFRLKKPVYSRKLSSPHMNLPFPNGINICEGRKRRIRTSRLPFITNRMYLNGYIAIHKKTGLYNSFNGDRRCFKFQ